MPRPPIVYTLYKLLPYIKRSVFVSSFQRQKFVKRVHIDCHETRAFTFSPFLAAFRHSSVYCLKQCTFPFTRRLFSHGHNLFRIEIYSLSTFVPLWKCAQGECVVSFAGAYRIALEWLLKKKKKTRSCVYWSVWVVMWPNRSSWCAVTYFICSKQAKRLFACFLGSWFVLFNFA